MGLCWREETQKPRDVIQTAHTFWKCKHVHILRMNKVTYKTSLYSCVYVQLPCLTQYFLGYSIAPNPKKNMLKNYGPFASLWGNESFQTFHRFLNLGLASGWYASYSTHVSTRNGWFRGEQRSFPESSRVFFRWHMRMCEKKIKIFSSNMSLDHLCQVHEIWNTYSPIQRIPDQL